MSGNGAVWGRVRGRLRAFPEHLAACGAEVRSCRAGKCLRDRKGLRGWGSDRRGGARAGPGRGLPRVTGGRGGRRDPRPFTPVPRQQPTAGACRRPRPQAAA